METKNQEIMRRLKEIENISKVMQTQSNQEREVFIEIIDDYVTEIRELLEG